MAKTKISAVTKEFIEKIKKERLLEWADDMEAKIWFNNFRAAVKVIIKIAGKVVIVFLVASVFYHFIPDFDCIVKDREHQKFQKEVLTQKIYELIKELDLGFYDIDIQPANNEHYCFSEGSTQRHGLLGKSGRSYGRGYANFHFEESQLNEIKEKIEDYAKSHGFRENMTRSEIVEIIARFDHFEEIKTEERNVYFYTMVDIRPDVVYIDINELSKDSFMKLTGKGEDVYDFTTESY